MTTLTPMMMQWHQCKKKAKDSLLLFRMGDFYEAFHEDASVLAEALNLTLTKRQGIPMSGVPHHASQNYIDRLVSLGIKVAIAEQMEDPKKAKGLVKRDLSQIITPGTLMQSNLLEAQSHNYIVCVSQIGSLFGLALLDITTADFRVLECLDSRTLSEEIYRIRPAEVIFSQKFCDHHKILLEEWKKNLTVSSTILEAWHFDARVTTDFLIDHFKVHSLDGFGLKGMMAATNAAGVLLNYINETLCRSIKHIEKIRKIEQSDYLQLDHITLHHLEIINAQNTQNKDQTLFAHLNQTQSAMGARLLREWVQKPLISIEEIEKRQDAIEDLLSKPYELLQIKDLLKQIQDIERLITKISTGFAVARDLNALKSSLQVIPSLKNNMKNYSADLLVEHQQNLAPLNEIIYLIDRAIVEDPPAKLGSGQTFKKGFHSELDEWVEINSSSKQWIAKYQTKVREETQIKNLKVGFNRVFGYYIEVSKGQASNMPASFQRKQTLTNNERFISEELKTYESKILIAEEKIASLENKLFEDLRNQVAKERPKVFSLAHLIAQIDCLLSLSLVAQKNHYTKPIVDHSNVLQINEGRHPILDSLTAFIPNDTFLDDEKNRLAIITGPNMAGKSTYIRQVALLVILSQIGSFIPAQSAHIGIVEKIFSRIGASDNLAHGQSTFMVEMVETANILNNLNDKSLIILDEIGRGTSTYDGIAIAQSTVQHLLKSKAKTLFATHYSELTEMPQKFEGVVNYTVSVYESNENITFLYKIIKGSTDKSYGIHVAKLAGLPPSLIHEANQILKELEETKPKARTPIKEKKDTQLDFLQKIEMEHPIFSKIKGVEIDHLSPMDALLFLMDLKKELK